MAVTKENILTIIALLASVVRQVKANAVGSLRLLCFATHCQNSRESAGILLSARHSSSHHSTR